MARELSGVTMAILGVATVVTVGAVGYALTTKADKERALAKIRRAKQVVEQEIETWRLPHPEHAVHLPSDPDEIADLEQLLAECASTAQIDAGTEDPGPAILLVRDCALEQLYPDFQWPTVTGDHPSVEKLVTIVEYEAAKAVFARLEAEPTGVEVFPVPPPVPPPPPPPLGDQPPVQEPP